MFNAGQFIIQNSTLHPLPGFRPEQFPVAIDTGPIAVDEGHRLAADRAVGWRTLVEDGKIRQLKILFFHGASILPAVLFLTEWPFPRSLDSALRQTSTVHR